ncbi:MAG: GMC family oxidoreductase [Oscillochloridaceae bacterium umkhey_bin13]
MRRSCLRERPHHGWVWTGIRLMPLPPADFQARVHIPNSGWPIDRTILDPYYERAQQVFQLGPFAYEGSAWATPEHPILPLDPTQLRTRMYQFGDGQVFLKYYRTALADVPNLTICYHATAVELESNADGTAISTVQVKSSPQKTFRVRASQIVVANGGFAATQLLLNSDAQHQGGIGNHSGNLGRYLMDHPYLYGGELIPSSRHIFNETTLYDMRMVENVPVMAHLQLADELLVREPMLGLSVLMFPRERNYEAHRSLNPRQQRGFDAFIKLRRDIVMGHTPHTELFRDVVTGADGLVKRSLDRLLFPKALIGRGGWSRLPMKHLRYHSFEIVHQAEQAPHRDNCVRLSHERDELGMRRIIIDWRWHAEDVAAVMRAQDCFATEFQRSGIGTFKLARQDGQPVVLSHSMAHYMGATRMHADPQQGVVDANCKVHGIANLYVASCSVFPTGGFANPTLTIVALAIRIADQVKRQLAGPPTLNLPAVTLGLDSSNLAIPA